MTPDGSDAKHARQHLKKTLVFAPSPNLLEPMFWEMKAASEALHREHPVPESSRGL